jgi:hypothetical protein
MNSLLRLSALAGLSLGVLAVSPGFAGPSGSSPSPATPAELVARVAVTVGDSTQEREIAIGESYMSTHDTRLHFGLGDAETVDQVVVLWPDGTRSIQENVKVRQFLVIRK